MVAEPAEPNPPISTEVPRGATISTAYAERQVKAYAVLESEIKTISFFNTLATVAFSVGAAFISTAAGIWTNAAFVTDKILPPEGAILAKFVGPTLCVLALIAFALGGWAIHSRRSVWAAISQQSKPPAAKT